MRIKIIVCFHCSKHRRNSSVFYLHYWVCTPCICHCEYIKIEICWSVRSEEKDRLSYCHIRITKLKFFLILIYMTKLLKVLTLFIKNVVCHVWGWTTVSRNFQIPRKKMRTDFQIFLWLPFTCFRDIWLRLVHGSWDLSLSGMVCGLLNRQLKASDVNNWILKGTLLRLIK